MKVVGSVKLVVKSAVIRHLFLGPQHALVWDTSVATMTKFIHKTLRSFESGRIIESWYNSALGVTLEQSMQFLVRGGLDISIMEGITEGVDIGSEDTWIGIRERHKRNFNLWSFVGFNQPWIPALS